MPRRGFRTTKAQRETVRRLRALIGEIGHITYTLAGEFRGSVHDFVAVPSKPWHPGASLHLHMLIVKAARDKKVYIQPYMPRLLYGNVENHLQNVRDLEGAYEWGEQLRSRALTLDDDHYGWLKYIPRHYRKRLLRELQLPGP